ncbi:MAG: hypothetical protein KA251_12045 [Saprospiraceae bacterium]|nr:hypothetical protein [Saprospiraceae bacterium]MBP6523717.1 hypothetical protein [Saprospiraceae bacterium]
MKSRILQDVLHLKQAYIDSIRDSKNIESNFSARLNTLKLNAENILELHDALLFILAHPANQKIKSRTAQELKKISNWCKRNAKKYEDQFDNSGLPYSSIYSYFSYELIQWLLENKLTVTLDNYPEDADTLNDAMWLTLPAYERDIVVQELNNAQLLSSLKINPAHQLNFLLGQFSKLDHQTALRDLLFERQKFVIKWALDLKNSRTYNKINFEKTYFQKDWIKKIETETWIKIPLPAERKLSVSEKQEILKSSRIKLALLQRETEPVSYMDMRSIRYFSLERGTAIALFTMKTEKQLYPESYIGYTLYKNGYPAAYGGAWIFGKHALIGVNIFEWFRGGESAFFFNQLLRVYHQVFDINHFEVEPYQYGKDNPEGIESGAFWFYYRMGFRPVQRPLYRLAEREADKIKADRAYRTKPQTLKQFTQCNVRLSLRKEKVISGNNFKTRITTMIHIDFGGDRRKAEIECVNWLQAIMDENILGKIKHPTVLTEMALMCRAVHFPVKENIELIKNMIVHKSKDLYEYQKNMIEWLSKIEK